MLSPLGRVDRNIFRLKAEATQQRTVRRQLSGRDRLGLSYE